MTVVRWFYQVEGIGNQMTHEQTISKARNPELAARALAIWNKVRVCRAVLSEEEIKTLTIAYWEKALPTHAAYQWVEDHVR